MWYLMSKQNYTRDRAPTGDVALHAGDGQRIDELRPLHTHQQPRPQPPSPSFSFIPSRGRNLLCQLLLLTRLERLKIRLARLIGHLFWSVRTNYIVNIEENNVDTIGLEYSASVKLEVYKRRQSVVVNPRCFFISGFLVCFALPFCEFVSALSLLYPSGTFFFNQASMTERGCK